MLGRGPALSGRGSVGSIQVLTAKMFPGKILTGHEMSAREGTGPVKKWECRVNTRLDCQDVPSKILTGHEMSAGEGDRPCQEGEVLG